MKISIVTICWNNERDIRGTIESVVRQDYPNIEYIIKDGGSKDHTLDIVNEYKDRISKIISAPDKGLYDAINEGIKAATGDVVGLIHAGDSLYDNTVIGKVAKHFIENDVELSYGHSVITRENGSVQRVNKSAEFKKSMVRYGWMPSHQSMYMRRELLNKYGFYRLDIGPSSDYEFCVRYLYKYADEIKIKRLDDYIIRFSLGGVSTKSYKERISKKQSEIIKKCWEVNGLKPPFGIAYMKLLSKVKQFLLAQIRKKERYEREEKTESDVSLSESDRSELFGGGVWSGESMGSD